jgi:hypothetical protein
MERIMRGNEVKGLNGRSRGLKQLMAGLVCVGMMGVASTGVMAAQVAHPAPPVLPKHVQGKEGVKVYLVTQVERIVKAAQDLKTAGQAYDKLVTAHNNDAQAAAKAEPKKVAQLIQDMRHAYERIDSYGYEYIEGIVAGVPTLVHYDVELDSGLPQKMATSPTDNVAQVVIRAGDLTLTNEGSLNNFLIEPTVFGTNDRFIEGKAKLPGMEGMIGLPKPKLVLGLADYALNGYTRLLKDSKAWQPSDRDCFLTLYNMTPTLADYFEEWKESKIHHGAVGGRFVAVSRVSDMRGIMGSVRLTWQSVEPKVAAADPALAQSISDGYAKVMTFIDTVDSRDQASPLNPQTIDALGSQAKERADKLTVQSAQAAALLKIDVTAQ